MLTILENLLTIFLLPVSSVRGHNGGNGSNVGGVGDTVMGAWGKVTSNFRHGDIPWNLFTGHPVTEPSMQN